MFFFLGIVLLLILTACDWRTVPFTHMQHSYEVIPCESIGVIGVHAYPITGSISEIAFGTYRL